MKFTIDRDVLLENLNIVSRGLPSKTSMPILNGIKLEVTNSDIYITSSNMDISIEVMISDKSLEIDEPGKTVILGKYFIDIIRKVNSKKVTLSILDDKQLLIQVDRGEYRLHVMNYEDYPNIQFITLENPLVINVATIKSIIKETGFATSSSEKRPIFTGVNFNLSNNELVCVGTDTFRLSQKKIDVEYNDFNITIPSKSLDELVKILDNNDNDLEMYFSNNKILFKYNKVLFQSRLLDGNFPNTSKVIPTSYNFSLKFNKDEIIDSVERVSLLSPHEREKDKEIGYSFIILKVSKDKKVQISSYNSQIGDAKEDIIATDVMNNDEKIEIGISSEYLIDSLRALDDVEIIIEILDPKRPIVVRGTNNNNLVQVILPISL